jgi:hypothetical protein
MELDNAKKTEPLSAHLKLMVLPPLLRLLANMLTAQTNI